MIYLGSMHLQLKKRSSYQNLMIKLDISGHDLEAIKATRVVATAYLSLDDPQMIKTLTVDQINMAKAYLSATSVAVITPSPDLPELGGNVLEEFMGPFEPPTKRGKYKKDKSYRTSIEKIIKHEKQTGPDGKYFRHMVNWKESKQNKWESYLEIRHGWIQTKKEYKDESRPHGRNSTGHKSQLRGGIKSPCSTRPTYTSTY